MSHPLSYDASKCVLQYLEANLRLNLCQRCPSLSTIDRLVPLHIDYLLVDPGWIRINDTTYIIGIIQVYNNGQTPATVRERNYTGGDIHDVDQYGVRRDTVVPDHLQMIRVLRMQQREPKSELRRLASEVQTDQRDQKIEELNLKIEVLELRILAYSLRWENAVPPFKHYLQCLIKSDKRVRRERFNYDERTAADAIEYLVRKLFEKSAIVVTHLDVGVESYESKVRKPLLPLAPGTLSVQRLKASVGLQTVKDCLQPIWKNKPLKSLEASRGKLLPGFNEDPLVNSSRHLIIEGQTTSNALVELSRNQNIHLRKCVDRPEQAEGLINTWKNSNIEVGKCYSIEFKDETTATNFLNVFQELPDAERGEIAETRHTTFPECVIIPIREDAELNVYCEKTSVEDRKFCWQPYIGKIKIQPRGYAVNLFL